MLAYRKRVKDAREEPQLVCHGQPRAVREQRTRRVSVRLLSSSPCSGGRHAGGVVRRLIGRTGQTRNCLGESAVVGAQGEQSLGWVVHGRGRQWSNAVGHVHIGLGPEARGAGAGTGAAALAAAPWACAWAGPEAAACPGARAELRPAAWGGSGHGPKHGHRSKGLTARPPGMRGPGSARRRVCVQRRHHPSGRQVRRHNQAMLGHPVLMLHRLRLSTALPGNGGRHPCRPGTERGHAARAGESGRSGRRGRHCVRDHCLRGEPVRLPRCGCSWCSWHTRCCCCCWCCWCSG